MWRGRSLAWAVGWLATALPGAACELCAIYSADNARGQSKAGFVFTVSESFIPYRTVLFNDEKVSGSDLDYRDSSITHLVPGYNFNGRFGVNLGLPLVYHDFKVTEVRYSTTSLPVVRTEDSTEFGLGDVSLIARWSVYELAKMDYGFGISVLAGVKFPTGDTDRIADEVEQTHIFESLLPAGTPHDPLGHAISGVHQHDLSPGSGSYDGIFGLTGRARWSRLFLNAQFQYYLRTEGESDFTYGDEIMASGGPGLYFLLHDNYTLNLQGLVSYDSMGRDEIDGRISNRTGFTAWYLGPQMGLTVGERFSAVAGVDLPLSITANGLQNVPDYRFHASLVWRF
jgi:hypothetical protein